MVESASISECFRKMSFDSTPKPSVDIQALLDRAMVDKDTLVLQDVSYKANLKASDFVDFVEKNAHKIAEIEYLESAQPMTASKQEIDLALQLMKYNLQYQNDQVPPPQAMNNLRDEDNLLEAIMFVFNTLLTRDMFAFPIRFKTRARLEFLLSQFEIRRNDGTPNTATVPHTQSCKMLVFESSDLDSAADTLVASFNGNTTSSPWRISYVLVQESVAERFLEMLQQKLQPYDQVFAKNAAFAKDYTAAMDTYTKRGFRLVQGKNDHNEYRPTLVYGAPQECLPLVGVDTFRTALEATKLANDKLKGESITLWTEEVSLAYELVKALKAHTVWVNCYRVFDPAVPFTTVSLLGSEKEIIERYTDIWVEQTFNVQALWTHLFSKFRVQYPYSVSKIAGNYHFQTLTTGDKPIYELKEKNPERNDNDIYYTLIKRQIYGNLFPFKTVVTQFGVTFAN